VAATTPSVEAVAVRDGRIVAVGDRESVVRQHHGASTRIVDLDGRTLLIEVGKLADLVITTATR
jgi:predicted amidohydrolase YtcJ